MQTACSTSLVAVHLAVPEPARRRVRHGAGRRRRRSACRSGPATCTSRAASSRRDGHCRPFDARRRRAPCRGSGVGVVVLKRLADALADGDTDPRGDPRLGGQQRRRAQGRLHRARASTARPTVIRAALRRRRRRPGRPIGYVEAHGTGTALGDPIEVAALTAGVRAATGDAGCCALGSVKTNIGHLDAAAGVAGLIKTVLALQHGDAPADACTSRTPEPAHRLRRRARSTSTPRCGRGRPTAAPRRAGVSSFGIGGTNAHVVLEEAPAPAAAAGPAARRPAAACCRRAPPTALDAAADAARRAPGRHPDARRSPTSRYTLQRGRPALRAPARVVVADRRRDAVAALRGPRRRRGRRRRRRDRRRRSRSCSRARARSTPAWAAELYRTRAGVPRRARRLRRAARARTSASTCATCCSPASRRRRAAATRPRVTQPALFAVEYALAAAVDARGASRPAAMLGHSIGEYVAALPGRGVHASRTRCALVAARGAADAGAARRARCSPVPLPEAAARRLLAGRRRPRRGQRARRRAWSSGPAEADRRARATSCGQRGVAAPRLHTSHAFHSAMMEPVLDDVRRSASPAVPRRAPRLPFVSNVTGDLDRRTSRRPIPRTGPAPAPAGALRRRASASCWPSRRPRRCSEVGPGAGAGRPGPPQPGADAARPGRRRCAGRGESDAGREVPLGRGRPRCGSPASTSTGAALTRARGRPGAAADLPVRARAALGRRPDGTASTRRAPRRGRAPPTGAAAAARTRSSTGSGRTCSASPRSARTTTSSVSAGTRCWARRSSRGSARRSTWTCPSARCSRRPRSPASRPRSPTCWPPELQQTPDDLADLLAEIAAMSPEQVAHELSQPQREDLS